MTLLHIANYRDHSAGRKFYLQASRVTEPLGFILKGIAGVTPVIERISFSGYVSATGDTNDIANLQLVTADANGNPVTPIAQGTVTAATSSTVFKLGITATLNQYAGHLVYVRSGTYTGQVRVIASNTAHASDTQITLSSGLGGTPTVGNAYSLLPRNTSHSAWASTTIQPIWPSWRLQVTAAGQGVSYDHTEEIRLGSGQGIGLFQFEHDNYTG